MYQQVLKSTPLHADSFPWCPTGRAPLHPSTLLHVAFQASEARRGIKFELCGSGSSINIALLTQAPHCLPACAAFGLGVLLVGASGIAWKRCLMVLVCVSPGVLVLAWSWKHTNESGDCQVRGFSSCNRDSSRASTLQTPCQQPRVPPILRIPPLRPAVPASHPRVPPHL